MTWKRWAIVVLLLAVCTGAYAYMQTFTPPPVSAYINPSGSWTPATSTATGGAVNFTPPPAGLYCFNSGTSQWVPCANIGGGITASGTPTVNALTKWISASTIGNSSLSDNGTLVSTGETIQAPVFQATGSAAGLGSNLSLGSASGVQYSSTTLYTGTKDVGLDRAAAGGALEVNNGTIGNANGGFMAAYAKPTAITVATLPAPAAGNAGQIRVVSDSTTVASEGQTCAGSGTATALAFSNGAAWKCF